jgi:hypothetical protein
VVRRRDEHQGILLERVLGDVAGLGVLTEDVEVVQVVEEAPEEPLA